MPLPCQAALMSKDTSHWNQNASVIGLSDLLDREREHGLREAAAISRPKQMAEAPPEEARVRLAREIER
jgi:hypothetical protein